MNGRIYEKDFLLAGRCPASRLPQGNSRHRRKS